jgi:hypothetical protein
MLVLFPLAISQRKLRICALLCVLGLLMSKMVVPRIPRLEDFVYRPGFEKATEHDVSETGSFDGGDAYFLDSR